jgi:tetratricopeptide (TPR) repeat protein
VQTLYELLGALPEDDADHLRAAFRKAVKASHPDNNPDDPDAPQRFRRIVRANAVLSDERQRAVYDSLLAEAQQERVLNSERRIFSETRYLVPGVISSMVIAFVAIGAFLLFERVLTVSVVPAQMQDISARASAMTAAMPTRSPDTVGLVGEHNQRADASVASEPDVPAAKEITAPSVVETVTVASADASSVVQANSEAPVVKDANYYRQRGVLAYHGGDLTLALVDFDLAIGLDPNLPDTYVDRAIVFRRMGDMKRALADIAEAKRIDDLKPR